jgi:tetratricopeptide (TPR) repeat protein
MTGFPVNFHVKSTKVLRFIRTVLAIGVLLFFLYYSPFISYKIGNIFFGDVTSLYNVKLAQFLFQVAALPIATQPYANYQLSRTYFIQGEMEHALQYAKRELELFPEHFRTYYILGLTYGYMDREEDAIAAFQKFIKEKPESWAARNDCAWLQFRIGDIDGALATILPIVSLTDNPWIQNTYGTLLLNKGNYSEAKSAFLNAERAANAMTERTWGSSYPGNDPRIYETGLNAMRISIEKNIEQLALITQ